MLPARAEQPAEHGRQPIRADRLGQEVVHAGHQAALAGLRKGVGGQGDDRHGGGHAVGQRADRQRGADAVEQRHVQVHQHDVEALLADGLHRLQAVAGEEGPVAHAFQQRSHVLAVDRVVLGHQHAQRAHAGECRVGGHGERTPQPGAPGRWHASGMRKLKLLPSPGHALGRDVAAHQPRQAARDLQAQPGAAMPPRARLVALRESPEQPVQRGLVHADAGVGDDELQLLAAVVGAGAVQVDHHHAAVGELHRVVHQVEQDLLDAGAVGPHLLGHAGVGVDMQRQRLELRLRPHQRFHLAQQVAQVDRLLAQRQPARFEQRHVEHVVQDGQQVVGRFGGGAQVVHLAGVQTGVAQQREHAQQAVEGRADLVAHVGQEHALGLAGGLGLAAALRAGARSGRPARAGVRPAAASGAWPSGRRPAPAATGRR